MPFVHDILRSKIYAEKGLLPTPPPAPSLDEIFRLQWSPEFERLLRNRLAMGYFRYGPLHEQIGKAKYDNVASMRARLDAYGTDRNLEHIVDVAGLCVVEFVTHPHYPFKASDDGIHAAKKREFRPSLNLNGAAHH